MMQKQLKFLQTFTLIPNTRHSPIKLIFRINCPSLSRPFVHGFTEKIIPRTLVTRIRSFHCAHLPRVWFVRIEKIYTTLQITKLTRAYQLSNISPADIQT